MSNIQLSDHFTVRRLLRFALPSILMMIFTSIYGIVDGYFVSNYAGKTPFAAVNFIYPLVMVLGSIGFMIGTGGSALIGKTLGEGHPDRANRYFSMLVWFSIGLSLVVGIPCILCLRPIATLMGTDEAMLDLCVLYGRIVLSGLPFLVLQFEFQALFVLAERPQIGLYATLAAGCLNMVLDWLLVGVLGFGIAGAASATVASQVTGGIIPLVYFSRENGSRLRLGRPVLELRPLLKALGNGSSEFVSNVSMSIVSMLYNAQLLRYAGEDGVAAYGVLMYVGLIFISIFIGYSCGTAPITSFHFGAKNTDELKSLLRKALRIILISAFLMLLAGELLSRPFAALFVSYDERLMDLTVRAFRFYSFTFLFAALPIYGSSFFTALNNGLVSAIISFLRTVVFEVAAVLLLAPVLGSDGIWLSLVVAEFAATCLAAFFLILKRKKYNYW